MLNLIIEYVQCYYQAFGLGMLFMFILGEVYGKRRRQRVRRLSSRV
jgi:hypothetical protein